MTRRSPAALLVAGLTLLGALQAATPASAGTVIQVTITQDTGAMLDMECSLREAIMSADYNFHKFEGQGNECASGSGNDTIELPKGIYPLIIGDFFIDPEPVPGTGDLDIFEESGAELEEAPILTINGNGSTVDATGLEHCCGIPAPDRVFHIHGIPVVINDLTIQGGGGIFDIEGDGDGTGEIVGEGGGIKIERLAPDPAEVYVAPGGALQLNNSTVRDNSADFGGGIYNNEGHLELHNSLVGGSLHGEENDPNIAIEEGGGIYTAGAPQALTVIIDGSRVDGNVAGSHGGGIYNGGEEDLPDRVEIINDSSVSNNVAGGPCLTGDFGGGNGGGIWTDAFADGPEPSPTSPGVFINDSTLADNQALDCPDTEPFGGNGGAIYSTGGHVEVTDSEIGSENEATYEGGGVWTQGGDTFILRTSTIDNNTAGTSGGGIYNEADHVQVVQSTISDNTAENGYGGGIWTTGPGLFIENSTISDNSAETSEEMEVSPGTGHGGGIYLGGEADSSFELQSVTLSKNTADFCDDAAPGSGCMAGGNIAIGNLNPKTGILFNTVLGGGVPENCNIVPPDDIDSLGYNLSSDTSCGLEEASDIEGQDPLLDDLELNKSENKTNALPPQSPAVDTGPPVLLPRGLLGAPTGCPATDQRGVSRPQDGNGNGTAECDRGSFEREPAMGTTPQQGPPVQPPRDCAVLGTPANDILIGTPVGETICGLGGDDHIQGGGGNDNLFGDEGDDTLEGGPGDDALSGGPGTDTGDYTAAPGSVDADLDRQTAVGEGASTDTLFELENLRGSPFADILAGSGGPNKLTGKNGNDRLLGRGGNDVARGSRGNDKAKGGAGNDTLNGGHDHDKLRGGSGEDVLTGGQKSDDLKGNANDDHLKGGGGSDSLNGNAGNDECDGGEGNDSLVSCET